MNRPLPLLHPRRLLRTAILVLLATAGLAVAAHAALASLDPDGAPVARTLPATAPPSDAASAQPSATPSATPAPTTEPPAAPTPPPLLADGDTGDEVRELQARLAQIDWYEGDVTGVYAERTAEAVRGFQAKRGLPATGAVDQATLDRLHAMTGPPSEAELLNLDPEPGALDPRCREGRVLCIDKTTSMLRWTVDGEVLREVEVRFGAPGMETREGAFTVQRKSRDHVSSLYDTSMPFAMFFSGGQAVHYSADFAAVGYAGASHGCVNVRDRDAVAALFDEVREGDDVIVYWS